MVMSTRTHTTLFAKKTRDPHPNYGSTTLIRLPLTVVPQYETRCHVTGAIIPVPNKPLFRPNLWTSDEHERFLHGLELFPNGPWKEVAKVVGTKTTRQTMTHAQKYRQKIERHMQGHALSKSSNTLQPLSYEPSVQQSPVPANHQHAFDQQVVAQVDFTRLDYTDEQEYQPTTRYRVCVDASQHNTTFANMEIPQYYDQTLVYGSNWVV